MKIDVALNCKKICIVFSLRPLCSSHNLLQKVIMLFQHWQGIGKTRFQNIHILQIFSSYDNLQQRCNWTLKNTYIDHFSYAWSWLMHRVLITFSHLPSSHCQSRTIDAFLSQSQCALSIATSVGKMLQYRQSAPHIQQVRKIFHFCP